MSVKIYGVKLNEVPDGQHFIARIAKNNEWHPFSYFEATINSEGDTCAYERGSWWRVRKATKADYEVQKVAAKSWNEHWTIHLMLAA